MQRLTELVGGFQVYAVCPPCARMEALALEALIARFGPDVSLSDIRPRLKCAVCGERSGELRVIYVGADGQAGTFHYRS
jgi:hypothetical protein